MAEASPATPPIWARPGRFLRGAINDQALRWPLLAPLALTVGAALYMTAPTEPGWELLFGATLPFALGWAFLRRKGASPATLILALIACAGIGAIAGRIRTEWQAAPVLRAEMGPVRIEGIIAEIDASERSRRMRIDVRAIEDLRPEQTPRFIRFSYKGETPFSPGRAVACSAILSPPPRPVVPGDYEFERDAWFAQLGAVGFATGQCEPLPTPPPATLQERFAYWIQAVRRAISIHVFEAAGRSAGAGMAAAMIAGDRSFIPPDDAEALRLSGLAHLLSISGVHMVLAGGIVFFFIRMLWPLFEPLALRAPTPRAAALGAIIACTLYFAISGAEVATQRAYIMAIIGFGAKLFDRPALSLRSLAVAMFVVVLWQPEAVVTPGFQMSFAASGALIALYEMWPRIDRPDGGAGLLTRIRTWVIGAAATSLVASLATMPFALHHFDRAALFSVIANIVTTPIITLWTTPAAAAAALAAPFGLDGIFLWLTGQSLDLVIAIGRYSVDASPAIDLPRLGGTGMALAAAAIGLFCILTRRGRAFAIIPATAAVAVWLTEPQAVGYVADDGSVFLQADKGWLELTDWRADNGLNPLIIGDDVRAAPCLGKGAGCWLDLPAGQAAVVPGADLPVAPCPTSAQLTLSPLTGDTLVVQPCAVAGKGGAVIGQSGSRLQLAPAEQPTGRPWAPPLYRKVPKPPKQPGERRSRE